MPARQSLDIQYLTRAGLVPDFQAAQQIDLQFLNDGQIVVEIQNTDSSPMTVAIVVPQKVDKNAVSSRVVTVPANDEVVGLLALKPLPSEFYNQADGMVHLDLSTDYGVSIALLHI